MRVLIHTWVEKEKEVSLIMKAEAVGILEDFIRKSVGAQYVIPVYQRNYTWKKNDQVKKLLEDLNALIVSPTKRHFIGSIVYIVTVDSLTIQERAVVDGQQRLTTIFLMLYALRDIAADNGDMAVVQQLNNLYLENITSHDRYKMRLKPTVSDDDVFEAIASSKVDSIQKKASTVYQNYSYIKKEMDQQVKSVGYDAVLTAMRRLDIVYINLDQSDNSQQIFESINSTGMALTAADLIRNFILMDKSDSVQEWLYIQYWLKIERIFDGTKKMEGFIRFYLGAKQYNLVTQRKLYVAFQAYWNEQKIQSSEEELLGDLLYYAQHYQRLYLSAQTDVLGEDLSDYRKMSSEMPAPLMMEVLDLHRRSMLTQQQVTQALKLVNTYMIRRYMMDKDTSDIVHLFAPTLGRVLKDINESYAAFIDTLKFHLIDSNRQKSYFMPNDEQVLGYFPTANAYSLYHTRWLLEKLETYNNSVDIVMDNLSIEHILPQTRSDAWTEVADVDDLKYENYMNRIGNLTLASKNDNSRMGNRDFTLKKKVLLDTSHLKLNQGILEKDQWTLCEIEERSQMMTRKLLEIYPYQKSTRPTVEQSRKIVLAYRGQTVALGCLNLDESVEVYADSVIKFTPLPSSQLVQTLHEELLENNQIVERDGVYILLSNQVLPSPSAAAEFVLGGSVNGWAAWKGAEGTPIKELFRSQSEDV